MLSQFLTTVAAAHGAESMQGAMIFAMLQRPLDELISQALAGGPYHRGKPSPWSHCFLLAEPYKGPTTKILDCTIRDAAGKVEWTTTLPEALAIVFDSVSGKGAGAIYDAVVSDYDDARVTAYGIKWLPGLSPDERARLVTQAQALQAAKTAYDLPGLLRELARLLVGIKLPPPKNRLFCSGFLQKSYRAALGGLGDFSASLRDEDTSPDDIWYSPKGLALVNIARETPLHPPATVKLYASSDALAAKPEPLESNVPPATARKEIERVLAKLEAAPSNAALADRERIHSTLVNALAQLDRAAQGPLGQPSAVVNSDEYDLSLVLSAMSSPKEPSEMGLLFGRDITGFHQYEDLDASWVATLWNRITRSKVPFPVAKQVADVVYQIPDATSIAIAGDWGTGNASSLRIAKAISELEPDYTIHLGDVYYSGTESEEQTRFIKNWPAGKRGSMALNSNHEMYSGGHGYFGVALADQKFRLQQGYSYFALVNSSWLVIGLDSAHGSSGMYANGVLNDAQLSWLRSLVASPLARSGGDVKNMIVLTHHEGMEMDGSRKGLFTQLTSALGEGPKRWYWGHVHGVAAFKPVEVVGGQLQARLVGHGGVPYAPDPLTSSLVWTENELAKDPSIPARARNGFALLNFTDEGLEETFYDEFGNERWRS